MTKPKAEPVRCPFCKAEPGRADRALDERGTEIVTWKCESCGWECTVFRPQHKK